MGYFIGFTLAVVFLAVLVAALAGMGSGGRRMRGTLPSDHPFLREKPAADEIAPGASVIAEVAQSEGARKKTPQKTPPA